MRHVSRTHGVALDWLFDRINLKPKIQIKYVDTKNQFVDMLTKGNFTRDEWNHLLYLLNISIFSLADAEFGSETAASSSTAPSSNASNRPAIFRAPSQQGSNLKANSGELAETDAASSSQV